MIIIVLSILRQALGTGQTPPNVVLTGLALFLTLFVMSPVFEQVYANAIAPYLDQKISLDQALAAGEAIAFLELDISRKPFSPQASGTTPWRSRMPNNCLPTSPWVSASIAL